MKIFFDTEFLEDGHTIEPLSIGMVTEDGESTLYLVITDTDRSLANEWVVENVLPQIDDAGLAKRYVRCPKSDAGSEIVRWLKPYNPPEFWTDYGSYDWVMLCQLFGPMVDLPEGWPMFVMDIQQYGRHVGEWTFRGVPESHRPHHALSDADECRRRYNHLKKLETSE